MLPEIHTMEKCDFLEPVIHFQMIFFSVIRSLKQSLFFFIYLKDLAKIILATEARGAIKSAYDADDLLHVAIAEIFFKPHFLTSTSFVFHLHVSVFNRILYE